MWVRGGAGCSATDVPPGLELILLFTLLLRRPRTGLVLLATLATMRPAQAEVERGFAIDRFEPAARGSMWFASDSLDLRGQSRLTLGFTGDYAFMPLAVYSASGLRGAIVREQAVLHLGGNVVLGERLRLGFSMPLALLQTGDSGRIGNVDYLGATRPAQGDLRFGADVRLFGRYDALLTVAVGVLAHLPTGDQGQWMGDGKLRASVHVLAAGKLGPLVYAARAAITHRESQSPLDQEAMGNEARASVSIGLRVMQDKITLGPELSGATVLGQPNSFLAEHSSPLEGLFGAHYRLDEFLIGVAGAAGLTSAVGTPGVRILFTFDMTPKLFGCEAEK
jgi:OOP family OmpA-OmpF porin